MEWYQEPYPGGAMVPVRGFPRPLYPPDAEFSGRVPSINGPDVEAYKRVVSRAGRWPWGAFDRSFSNAFSHGRSGNVGETGVAGVQRQLGVLPDSGWVGKDTFNGFRSIRIPEGLPNAGQPAMDARAVELIEQAYATFNPDAGIVARKKALNHMEVRLGYTEQPWGSNTDNRVDGIRAAQVFTANGGTWLIGKPWCGSWCCYALGAAGVQGIDWHLASVAQIEDNARAGLKCYRGWTTDPDKVRPGDLAVVFGYGVHVEMVRSEIAGSTVNTYGGNTSPGSGGSQSNGGGAYARTRPLSDIRGFARVEYPGD